MHDERIDVACDRMGEGERQPADGREPCRLPERDRAGVGGDDEVELHRPEPRCPRDLHRMIEQSARNALSAGLGRGGEAGVGNVRPAAALVRAEKARAEDPGARFGDEHAVIPAAPVVERLGPADLARDAVGLAGGEDRAENRPQRVAIVVTRGTNQHDGRRRWSIARAAAGPAPSPGRRIDPIRPDRAAALTPSRSGLIRAP